MRSAHWRISIVDGLSRGRLAIVELRRRGEFGQEWLVDFPSKSVARSHSLVRFASDVSVFQC
jgi:hypothetical protein